MRRIEAMPISTQEKGREVKSPLWERLTKMVTELIQKSPDEKFKEFASEKMNDPRFEEERRRIWNVTILHHDEDPEKEELKLAQGLITSIKELYKLEQRKN